MIDGPTGKFDQQNGEIRDFTPSSSANQTVHLNPDSILFDKFRVIKLLGRGGMGSVYRVQHLHLRTEYALKCLNKQQHNDATWRRFENEARASNKLDHPNLIKVHDSGLLPDGQPYFVMDLVDGVTLADEIKKTGRLPVHVVLKLFIQVGFALSYAHERGVIHRDIKPTNIMLVNNKDGTLSNSVKVVDFGIAKLTGQDEFNQQTLTRTGEIFGSPLYMSPEQCMGISVDHRSDLYSLGCVMYEALTGAPPIVGDNALSTMMKHQTEKPLSLKQASMGLEFAEQLEFLVQKLLEKDPKNRYSNASLLTADLVALEQNLHSGVTMSLNMEDLKKKPVLSKNQRSFSDPKTIAISLVAILSAYGLGIATGTMISKDEKPRPAKVKDLDSSLYQQAILKIDGGTLNLVERVNASSNPMKTVPIDYKAKYFSSESGPVRVFHFPKIASLGYVESTFAAERYMKTSMQGDVTLQIPVTIYVNDNFLANSYLASKFKPNEVVSIRFDSCQKPVGEFFAQTAKYTLLNDVDLSESTTGRGDLKYLDKNVHVSQLTCSKSNMTVDDVLHLKRLLEFGKVSVCGMPDVKPLLKALQKSEYLNRLELGGCNLDIDDLKQISELKHINYVDLTSVKCVNDTTMPIFLKAQEMQGFDLENCNITRASIPTFQAMRNLRYLRLTDPEETTGPDSFQWQFEKALPRLEFTWLEPVRLMPNETIR